MKTVLLGGSSFSTPALFEALASACLDDSEFVLVGRSARQLAAVVRAASMVGGPKPPRITSCTCDPKSSERVLNGADVVILQIRVGGLKGREFDEACPLAFGL
jgi:6-phospho-beta-glucosidase